MAASKTVSRLFTKFANAIARLTGRPVTFALCCFVIVAWAVSGPVFHFSDTWQLVINTGTTIVTFLMVFLIQNTQNRDGAAIQAKLDELIRALEGARNHFVGIEHLTEEELEEIRDICEKDAAEQDENPQWREKRGKASLHKLNRALDRLGRR
ncbi:MAG: low affinity iron permease family protein [Rhodospirillaceae bacterium]|nr:MAG: low affinity iron permease family protein [Rhodospirillaceae bacterium]